MEISKLLTPGTYYLVETETPPGYRSTGATRIVIDADGVRYYQDGTSLDEQEFNNQATIEGEGNEARYVLTIDNFSSVALPRTGGAGTQAFTWGGIALMTAATAALFGTRRKKKGGCV